METSTWKWLWQIRRNEARTGGDAVKRSLARQAGMTLLEILIVLAIIALVMGFLFGPKLINMFVQSKEKLGKIVVHQYANESYGRWALDNTGKVCPDDINELAKYADQKEAKDPWDHKLVMFCGDNKPEGVTGQIGVLSFGPDGKQDTTDDIRSWDDGGKAEGK